MRAARSASACSALLILILAGACDCGPALPDVVAGAGGQWELLPPLAQGPRQETAVVALRGEVVVVGGFNGFSAIVPLVETYDPVGGVWRRLADTPVPLHHANGAVVDDTLIIAGFLLDGGFNPDGRVFAYDVDTDEWSARTSMPAGTERGAAGCAAHDGFVYVFGGSAGGSSSLASRYDVDGDAWEALPDLPVALDHLGAATIDDEIFIVGGRTNGIGNHTTALLSFDTVALAYTERASMPTSRAGFGVGVVDGELYVAGGEGNGAADNGVFPEAQVYDPLSDAWRSVVDMRTPRHGMGAAGVDGAFYVPGGADVQAFAAVDVFERFVPSGE